MINVRALLQLIRLPNCFTAVPDTLAGFLAAVAWTGSAHYDLAALAPALAVVGLVGFLAYAGGVAMNDLFDLRHDREHRPERPLPSGRVSVLFGTIVAFGLLGLGVFLGISMYPPSWPAGAALIVLIVAYNLLHKRAPKVAMPLMGLSRAMSVLFGMAIGGLALDETLLQASRWPLLVHPIALAVYVLSISFVARFETRSPLAKKMVPWMILGIAILDAVAVAIYTGDWLATVIVAVWIIPAALLARRFEMS